ncbi:MAG: methionyl-tRNA formyltransferase [Clostridia bacterium]|nr:methionyl-tRNA formyltransferase [Clostridia bacterium]
MSNPFRIVFMGTPDFAVSALRTLVETGQNVVLVLTQPDRPKGRGYALQPSPVRSYALEQGIKTETPATLRCADSLDMIRQARPDLIVVAAYGKILPKEVLELPPLGCVNLHASLLPAWRGAAPIQRAVLNGDEKGGITVMQMDEGLDTGDILLIKEVPIGKDMTSGEYHDELAKAASAALKDYLLLAEAGTIVRNPQEGESSYAAKIEKEEGFVSFRETALQTHNRIRGCDPSPGAYAFLAGKRIKLFSSHLTEEGKTEKPAGRPGQILGHGPDGLRVACETGYVSVGHLQPEGKGRLDAASFFNGLSNKQPGENGWVFNE